MFATSGRVCEIGEGRDKGCDDTRDHWVGVSSNFRSGRTGFLTSGRSHDCNEVLKANLSEKSQFNKTKLGEVRVAYFGARLIVVKALRTSVLGL